MGTLWYQSGKVMRTQRQRASVSPRYIAQNLDISPKQYKLVERGELRISGETLPVAEKGA